MKIKLSDLWRWDGKLDRGPYVILGLILFGIKYNLDRIIAGLFGHTWTPSNYLIPSILTNILFVSGEESRFYAAIIAGSFPFICVGTFLTLRRLRSAQLPLWIVFLFFIPLLNFILFTILSILPTAEESTPYDRYDKRSRWNKFFDKIIPDHQAGSAAMAMLLTIPPMILGTVLAANTLGSYGWGLFIGIPFVLGLGSVLVYGYHQERNLGNCLLVAFISLLLTSVILLVCAVEGLICILMAAPLATPLALLGGFIGYLIQLRPKKYNALPQLCLALLLLTPTLMGLEYKSNTEPDLLKVSTSIEINAPPEKVWQHVVSFSQLPPPQEFLFHTGIAYPIKAEISGTGIGAVRHCVFSTGAFVEPIEIWDEPKLLKFSVTSQPEPMHELTLYSEIHPPHLNNYLVSEGGQFLLTQLPNGHTLLEGTTWYKHKIWPSFYWRLWSNKIISTIHSRVLIHIKTLCEE